MKLTSDQYLAADFVALRRGDHFIVIKNRKGRVGRVDTMMQVLLMTRHHDAKKVIIGRDDAS